MHDHMTTQENLPYFRPIVQIGPAQPDGAYPLTNGPCWFTHAEKIVRDGSATVIPASEIPADILARLTTKRPDIWGLKFERPIVMGILNVTPDSFSDGGAFSAPEVALAHARQMVQDGADIVDIGGESTRPNAEFVSITDEIARTAPVISALSGAFRSADFDRHPQGRCGPRGSGCWGRNPQRCGRLHL
jgi:dihydropteroate synthase